MDRKYLQIGGTGLLLAALGVGFTISNNSDSTKIQKVTILPQKKEDNSLDGLVKVDIADLCSITGAVPDESFLRLSSLLDSQGKPIFNCEEKLLLLQNRIEISYIEELSTLKDLHGKFFFTAKDIIAYNQARGTFDYVKKFANEYLPNGDFRFKGYQMAQLYALGISVDEMLHFKDTAKPNALLIFPAKDNESGTFRNQDVIAFYNELKKSYDVQIKVAAQEQEVYDALDAAKKVELLTLLGHGVVDHLSLGENDLRYALAERDETYTIDTSDWELGWHLQNLSPSATIFLYSCLTGQGKKEEENLANAVAEWADGRKVIAPTKVLYTSNVKINNLYPFDVSLFDTTSFLGNSLIPLGRKQEDITYITSNQF